MIATNEDHSHQRSYDREDLWLCLSSNILMK